MKKLFALFVVAGMISFVACGPSAEEIAAKEKAKADSIARADSIAKAEQARIEAEKAAAEAAAAAEKAKQDSIAAAEAAKKKAPVKKTPAVKPGTGRG